MIPQSPGSSSSRRQGSLCPIPSFICPAIPQKTRPSNRQYVFHSPTNSAEDPLILWQFAPIDYVDASPRPASLAFSTALTRPTAATKKIGAYIKRRHDMTFQIHSSRRADETTLARANRRAGLKYSPAMSFAEAPRTTQVTVILPHPGLEAPFDYGAPFSGDPTSIPTNKHARKARRSCDVRL